jgi:hypothetical protein
MNSNKSARNIKLKIWLCFFCIGFFNAQADEHAFHTAYTQASVSNLRAYGEGDAEIVKKLPINTRVKILDKKVEWFYVEVSTKEFERGWINRSLLDDHPLSLEDALARYHDLPEHNPARLKWIERASAIASDNVEVLNELVKTLQFHEDYDRADHILVYLAQLKQTPSTGIHNRNNQFAGSWGCDDEQCDQSWYFQRGNLQAVKTLFDSTPGEQIFTSSIFDGVRSGNIELIKYLKGRGWLKCPWNGENDCNYLSAAIMSGKLEVVEYVLESGFPIDIGILRVAAMQGKASVFDLFCKAGINFSEKFEYQIYEQGKGYKTVKANIADYMETNLSSALGVDSRGIYETIHILSDMAISLEYLKSGACHTENGRLVLQKYSDIFRSIKHKKLSEVQTSLEDLNLDSLHPFIKVRILYDVLLSGNMELLNYLDDLSLFDTCHALKFCYPLHAVAENGSSPNIANYLLSKGFSPSKKTHARGASALYFAVMNSNEKMVKVLCDNGADINEKLDKIYYGNTSTVKNLREAYWYRWCDLNITVSPKVRDSCDILGPIDIAECELGADCLSVKFPPNGPRTTVDDLIRLSKIDNFFRNNKCSSGK